MKKTSMVEIGLTPTEAELLLKVLRFHDGRSIAPDLEIDDQVNVTRVLDSIRAQIIDELVID